ncbi:YajQ family cyclic di-GMP-binding protein [Alicyclobacillaceae bacterium I2511]|nr:YajQ family cyclic di-GMP-binding protein [Alicyclobacillaceae bacterium I2511]
MAKEASFDVVSEVDVQEVSNAVSQARKEVQTRFDFKGSKCQVEFDGTELVLLADDDYKLTSLTDVLESKLIKRGVSLKALKKGKTEPATGGTVRQRITLQQGIDQDTTRIISKMVKDAKLKVQASIQGDQVRITGKNKDDLQAVIQLLQQADLPIPLQFSNYRS